MQNNINNNMNNYRKKIEEVALYIRVSTDEQAINGDSLRTQREELTKFALKNNYHIYDIYEDDGFSATNLKRPALQRMLEDVRNGKINRILITKLDRLSRGVRNYYKILDVLDEHGVYWSTAFEKYDSSTANGRLHINIMLSVAENESAQTSERIRSVFKTKLQSKEIISGKIPVGYKKEGKKLIIDEDKKQVVIDIYNNYLKTASIYKTFSTLPQYNLNYRRTATMLKNKLYLGIKTTKYGEEIDGFCEPIIDQETFYKVQNLLSKNERKRNNKSDGYIFRGILKCAKCKLTMSGKYTKSGYHFNKYYVCRNSTSFSGKKCNCTKNLNEIKIEEKLLININRYIEDYIVNSELKTKNIKKQDYSKEISVINKQLQKLRDLYIKDLIKIEHYETEYKTLTKKLEELEKKQKLENSKNKKTSNSNIKLLKQLLNSNFAEIYNNLNFEEKRRLWLSILDTIYIDENYNMQIFFL